MITKQQAIDNKDWVTLSKLMAADIRKTKEKARETEYKSYVIDHKTRARHPI